MGAMTYDVIVVGAGPAGSAVAREAASVGLSVVLLDKAEFPRDKPCGGGVTVRLARVLPVDVGPVVEREIRGIRFTLREGDGFTRRGDGVLTYLTQRRRLDAFLVERAVEAGATLRQGTAVRAVERQGDRVVVRAGNEAFEGRALVAADGANGRTARLAGIETPRWLCVGLEANVTPQGGVPVEWADVLGLDVGGVPGGYGWLFPKGDHVNVGVAGWQHLGPTMRGRLERLTRFYEFDPDTSWGLRGHHLPIRRPGAPLADGNVLLAGDAAGLLDPFTGEGMYAAVRSGSMAARHLARWLGGQATDLDGYRREVERELLPELRVSRQLQDVFHAGPGVSFELARRVPVVWRLIRRLLVGDQTFDGFKRRLGPADAVLDLLSDAARATPVLRRRAGLDGLPEPPGPERFLRGRGA